jgi:hypothetical protein
MWRLFRPIQTPREQIGRKWLFLGTTDIYAFGAAYLSTLPMGI